MPMDVVFPLTPALSLGERENHWQSGVVSAASRHTMARPRWLQLPEGEGWGEGEHDVQRPIIRRMLSKLPEFNGPPGRRGERSAFHWPHAARACRRRVR